MGPPIVAAARIRRLGSIVARVKAERALESHAGVFISASGAGRGNVHAGGAGPENPGGDRARVHIDFFRPLKKRF